MKRCPGKKEHNQAVMYNEEPSMVLQRTVLRVPLAPNAVKWHQNHYCSNMNPMNLVTAI